MGLVSWAALAFAASLLAAWAAAQVAISPLRAAAAASTPWVERARLAFPARATSRFALLLLPAAYAVFAELQPDDLSAEHPVVVGLAAALPALVATFLVRLWVERTVRGRAVGAGEMLRGWLAMWAVLFPHAAVAGVGLALVTDAFDTRTCAALGCTALAVVAAFGGAGVALARALRIARPASERLLRAVEAASTATGVRPRAVLEVDLMMANAFALPAAGLLLFTTEAVRTLGDEQIAAVARHELGHVSESRAVVVARGAGAVLVVVSLVAARPVSGVLTPEPGLFRLLVAVLVILAAVLVSRLALRPLAHRMEQRADAIAHAHDAGEGEYARALEGLYAANLMPAVTAVRGAHPHLYDRLVAAGAPPAWPRPAPPSRSRLRAAMLVCIGITVVALTAAVEVAGIPLPGRLLSSAT
jgi:Zn-dependent protease with chaperone function